LINFSRVKYLARPEPAYLLKKNDILYSHINSIKHMGKVALYDGMSPLYHGMNLMLLRPNESKVHPKFLFVYLSSEFGRAHARKECKSAINQASLGQGDIKNLKIHLPSLSEQRRIAEILDTIDEAIQKTEALISKLKAMKQGLLHDLLTRGLDKNGKLRDPKAHPEQFKDSPLGRIPKEWDVRPLGVTATLQRGFDLPIQDRRAGDVPIFGSNGIDGHHNESRVSGPGVITGRSGSIGFVYYTDTNFWPLNTTLYVKEFHGNRPKFIRLFLESLRLDRFTAATGVPSLNRNFVHPIEVTVPEPAEQDRIVDVVEAHDARIRTEEQYRDKLKLQKKGLMHDLLTGKVRVQSNDNIAC
jgi:type I restriction enzyme S subunit